MADENAQPGGGWEWMLEESGLRLSCVLIFARDVTQDQVFEAFGIDAPMESLNLAMHGKNVGRRLSAGTEVVLISSTAKPTENFEYWADGTWVTTFEPYRAFDRVGAEPDRFLREMRQGGMATEANNAAEGPEDDLGAALDLATLALGIRLSREIAMGPLATVTLAANRSQP